MSALDVATFLAWCRLLFVPAALAWLALVAWSRRPALLLLGALLGNVWLWGATNWPLQRIYGLGPSSDRLGNLGLVQVVAAGNSPLRTAQVGQLHFEPFWGLVVAAASGWSPDRVLQIYPFLSLVMACGLALSLYAGLTTRGSPWSPWERALVAGFATLLCSSPLDFTEAYRVPWAKLFLLKPNHALALVMFPLVLRAFATMRGWRGRILVGLLLHLLAWAFVLHMVFVAAGLVVFALSSVASRSDDRRRDLWDVAGVLLVNVAIVSPYLVMLLVGYPFLQRSADMVVNPSSAHLLETTTRIWPWLLLGLWGCAVAWRRDRLGRVWATQVLSAQLVWAGCLLLSLVQMARELDEIYYWNRILIAASAGIGAWDLAQRGHLAWRRWATEPAHRAALAAALALPFTMPVWWDPASMDPYFRPSLAPVPAAVAAPLDYLRHQTDPTAVVAGDRDFARWVAALGARRVLLSNNLHMNRDQTARIHAEEALIRVGDGASVRNIRLWGVQYLLATPRALVYYPEVTLADLQRRASLEQITLTETEPGAWIALFRIREPRP